MRFTHIVAVVAFLGLSTPVLAQQQGDRGARMMQALFQNITLNDQQQKQVDSIRAAYRPQLQSAERDQRRELFQKESADFRSVLTSDQQSQFDKNMADMRSHMRGGGGGSPQ
jgi:Spy/CpxP family protein refolding chaperone